MSHAPHTREPGARWPAALAGAPRRRPGGGPRGLAALLRGVLPAVLAAGLGACLQPGLRSVPPAVAYGSNPDAGATFTHDGVSFYYEVYGSGHPLLLVHGNGGSIADFAAQIADFGQRYRVIAMDGRDQGRSGDSPERLTYELLADDLAALLEHLHTGPVDVLGWGDGATTALLLGLRHPDKVRKLAVMSASLDASEAALFPEVRALVAAARDAIPPATRDTPAGRRARRVLDLALEEPRIDPRALRALEAPTLVMTADADIVRIEHTLAIYRHLPNAWLVVFPGETHLLPFDAPARFDATAERFFITPFVQKDRVEDLLASLVQLRAPREPGPPLRPSDLERFARAYTAAWCSHDAARVASFFAPDGSLTINDGEPAVGTAAIAAAAQAFMTAFPDLVVTMDAVVIDAEGLSYRWTLSGTNSGPEGTGRALRISGHEEWTLGADGRIARSLGHYDEAELRRQLEHGAD